MTSPLQPARLNALWRVLDDGQRWRLEERFSRLGRGDLWMTRGYFIERAALLEAVHLQCGALDTDAVAAIERWPAVHRRPRGD